MPTINDADGTPVNINEDNKMETISVTLPLSAHSADDGDAYTVLSTADAGAVTCDFFYLKNTSDEILRIYEIKVAPPALSIEISITVGVTGDPTAGTTLIPVNALVGSGNVAECICEQKDGDMALTGGNVFDVLFVNKDFVGEQVWNYPGEIALEKNQALVFNNDIDPTSDVDITVYFYFHEPI